MKISYNWLKEYIKIDQSPKELAEVLTNTGLEVEGIETFSTIKGGLAGLVVGEVLDKKKHPNADKLSVATVDVGSKDPLNIVCGASNLEAGQKVVVATVGSTIFPISGEPFTIKKAKLRGESSMGMICAEDEIGLGSNHDGIMVLDKNLTNGSAVSDLYTEEIDYVFEIGLTPNRTDAMSHIGVAKDIAAALNVASNSELQICMPLTEVESNAIDNDFKIEVKNIEACPRYSGVILKDIEIKDSPKWLQTKLLAVGVRPINNIVDITNYVLKEFGQALHAFDLNAVKGNKIVVKTLEKGTIFKTLDGIDRKMSAEDLMICNADEAMCIAGVFGGAKSGVSKQTKAIFLESAYFDSSFIRKTSTRHGLRTDAAQRYEKGADPTITMKALKRAVELMQKLAGASIASPFFDHYPKEIKAKKITLRLDRLNKLSGNEFKPELVSKILRDLDFKVMQKEIGEFELTAPLYRADVTREADVIEEVMRIYGFNNIAVPNVVKSTLSFQGALNPHQLKENVAFTLNGMGFSEIMTNSISQSRYYQNVDQLVMLQNSMTSELDSMRASIIPEALNVLRHNINRKKTNLKFYEFGNIYHFDHNQEEILGLYYTGDILEYNWNSPKQIAQIFHLKGLVEALLEGLGLKNLRLKIKEENTIILSVRKFEVAKIKEIDADALKQFEIEQRVFVAELKWQNILSSIGNSKIRFEELVKFPEVSRDLAVILEENVTFKELQQKILQFSGDILKKVDLFDVFRNAAKIGENKKSYALNFRLQDVNKTLTDKEIDQVMHKIIKTLEQQFNATIRQ